MTGSLTPPDGPTPDAYVFGRRFVLIGQAVDETAERVAEAYASDPHRRSVDWWAGRLTAGYDGAELRGGIVLWVRDRAMDVGNRGRAPVFPEAEPW